MITGDILRLMKDTATQPEQLKVDAAKLARIIGWSFRAR